VARGNAKQSNIEESKKIKCPCCNRELTLNSSNFYKSSKSEYEKTDGFCYTCKQCLRSLCFFEDNTINLKGIHTVLEMLNKPFIKAEYMKLLSKGSFDIGTFLKNVSFNQYSKMTYADSDSDENGNEKNNKNEVSKNSNQNSIKQEVIITTDDKKNEDDVLRILGYDPFESENQIDKKYLYNRLIDFLDESTLEDSFKLPAVIEIVKSFNQIDKINQAIASITSDIDKMASGGNVIKSLIDSKEKMLKTILALAKDNGISVNHNNSKSKGSGTLSGIMKKLQELGFDEASVNLFNVETANGLKQVADISNKSILEQLMFDENDSFEMIKEQRILIDEYRSKCEKLEEENRQLKIKLFKLKDGGL
jgi:hypothetical protein